MGGCNSIQDTRQSVKTDTATTILRLFPDEGLSDTAELRTEGLEEGVKEMRERERGGGSKRERGMVEEIRD